MLGCEPADPVVIVTLGKRLSALCWQEPSGFE